MKIHIDKREGKLILSPKKYIEKVFERFGMPDAKHVKTPLVAHFWLSADLSAQINEEEKYISHVPMLVLLEALCMLQCALDQTFHMQSVSGVDKWTDECE